MPLPEDERDADEGDDHVDQQERPQRIGAQPAPGNHQAAEDEPGRGHAQNDAPELDREQGQAIGIEQRHHQAADEVVEAAEEDQGRQPWHRPDRRPAAGQVEGLRPVLRVVEHALLGNRDKDEVDQRQNRGHDRQQGRPPHAEQADGEAGEDRGGHERQPLGRADQAVRPVALAIGHQQRHGRRQRDIAHVLDHGATQDQPSDQPEPHAAQVDDALLGQRQEQSTRSQERPGGDDRGRDHHLFLLEPVDEPAEEDGGDRQQRHIAAADDRVDEHRPGLEIDPEAPAEPQERGRKIGDDRVDQHTMEVGHDGPVVRCENTLTAPTGKSSRIFPGEAGRPRLGIVFDQRRWSR